MRRALVFTWLSGSATGVLLGLFGVQLVTSGITMGRTDPLSHPEVLSALRAAEVSAAPQAPVAPADPPVPAPQTETVSEPPLPDPVSQPAARPPASPPPRPGATAVPAAVPIPPATAPPATAPPSTAPAPPTTVVEPAKPAKPVEPATTTTKPADQTPPSTKPTGQSSDGESDDRNNGRNKYESRTETISSSGGIVSVRYENGKVKLLWARPNAGYSVKVVDDGPHLVEVRFRNDTRRSRILAYYKDGVPAQEVREGSSTEDSWDGRWRWSGGDWDDWQAYLND